MAGSLAAVPEESMDWSWSTAAYSPRGAYRDSIRRVAVSGAQIRSTLFSHSHSGHSGFGYSSDSASNSYPSNNSGCSSGSALSADLGVQELKMIARQMVYDGYAQRKAEAYRLASPAVGSGGHTPSSLAGLEDSDGRVNVLESWFLELDVAWVLQIRQEHGSLGQLCLQDNSVSSLQDLVESWIRGLTVIVACINDPVYTPEGIDPPVFTPGDLARFGEASISKMVVFVDAIVPVLKAENLWAVLDMYVYVCRAMDSMENSEVCSSMNMLRKAISSTTEKVMTLFEEDDSWAIEILRGGSAVHRNTRWIADCIVSLGEAEAGSIFVWMKNRATISPDSRILSDAKYDTIRYLKDLLLRKSELCSDPSLRYLFLLNNYYFVTQRVEPCQPGYDLKLTPECEKYMFSYLDISWGHLLSCIPKSHFPGPIHRWISTSSLVKFESAFNKTYQAQKFWKVPDPRLRDVLRRAITERVVSSYRDYLNEHPELAEHVSRRNTTPNVLEEMLGQIFEG